MFFASPSTHFYIRATVAGAGAIASLLVARKVVLPSSGKMAVGNVIAFDAAAFVILGMAVLVTAADRWPGACLCAGAALFAGGLVGLLFGLPFSSPGPAPEGARALTPAVGAPPAPHSETAVAGGVVVSGANAAQVAVAAASTQRGHTLLVEAASWFSKFLAGATFAQFRNVMETFHATSKMVSAYILVPAVDAGETLGGALILYFSLLGFLCGLLLPAYFMETFLAQLGASGGGPNGGGGAANGDAEA